MQSFSLGNEQLEMQFILALSGPVAVGKTTLCESLVRYHEFAWLRTRDLIQTMAGVGAQRRALQDAGAQIEKTTKGAWISDFIMSDPFFRTQPLVIVDSVRLLQQVESLRLVFGPSVFHIHLTARPTVLMQRYAARAGLINDDTPHAAAQSHEIESGSSVLKEHADFVVDTSDLNPAAIFSRVVHRLGNRLRHLR